MHLKTSSVKWRPFCPAEDELSSVFTKKREFSWYDVDFGVTGGTAGCRYDNLWCRRAVTK